MTKTTLRYTIFRFGNTIAEVENKEALRKWIIDNVPYNGGIDVIPQTTRLEKCLEFARKSGYKFTAVQGKQFSPRDVENLEKLLYVVNIAEVAADLGFTPAKRGEVYTCKCPHCKADSVAALIPSRGIYRCFACGETGNAIGFVKAVRRMGTDDAVNFLESKYINK